MVSVSPFIVVFEAEQLDDVGKSSFRLPEVPDAGGEEESYDGARKKKAAQRKFARRASQRPAESIDHPDHGVEIVEETKFFRDYAAAETDGRDVETKLDDKWNHVAKVAIFHI